jgi:hypothetical protein
MDFKTKVTQRELPAEIRAWSDEHLATELRNPLRISLGGEAYQLLLAEALARLLLREAPRC